ncbi:PaaI family thioesterase [Kocuria palustris]|uniref:PaaI family thioesterase n=1 Tax=Kocuria palustris TaxID=71999 RepID=UPI00246870F6|nr:hotdog fold thioesterase [Kocuria palustris]MDH5152264.1 hotdog fold thioesterase [Kocuria palustris]
MPFPQMLPSPALQAIGRDFLADDATVVRSPRQPGDLTGGTRVTTIHGEHLAVLARMPQDPVASHLGVAADISVAQGIREGLGKGESMLTLSLRVEQLSAPRSGETLRGAGQLLSAGPTGIVARGVLVGEDGRAVAESLGRFMAVDGPGGYAGPSSESTQQWGEVAVPQDWARLLPLQDDDGRFTVVPDADTANSAGIMHGGIQMRLHELAGSRVLAARAQEADGSGPSASEPEQRQRRAVSIETTYHRPVPVGGPSLSVEVEVLKEGRRIAITQSQVRDPQGRLLGSSEIVWARG